MSIASDAVLEAVQHMDEEIELTIPQTQFFTSKALYTAAVAGFGSGKTQAAVSRLMSTKLEYPTIDLAYLAPTYSLIRDIFYPYIGEILSSLDLKFNINKSEHNIYIEGHGRILCRTMDNPDMLVGWEAGDGFLDEFDVLKTDKALAVMRKLSARLRQKFPDGKLNQRFVTTTPEGFKATYQLFKKDPLKNSKLIQMSTYSNEHNLPDDYIQGLIDLYPSQLIEAYLMGEFVNLQAGTVYYNFDRRTHDTKYVAKPRETIHVGLDFNVHDMCGSAHVKRGGALYAVDEFFGLRDTPDMCDALTEAYQDHQVIVYPDASGKGTTSKSASLSDIKILTDAGFKVRARSSNPLIKNRVASVNKQFELNNYFINCKRCPELALSYEQQAYNPVTGQPEKDGHLDNRVDGAGYLQHYLHPIVHRKLTERQLGGF